MALSDIYDEHEPSEDPYVIASEIGFRCSDLEVVDGYDTAREFWNADHGDLMLALFGRWLFVNGNEGDDHKVYVRLVCSAARLALSNVTNEATYVVAEAAISAAEGWANGDGTTLAEVEEAGMTAHDLHDASPEAHDALLGAWSATRAVTRKESPFQGDDTTYAAIAALVRETYPLPTTGEWAA